MKRLIVITCAFIFISCSQNRQAGNIAAVNFDSAYRPPVFADAGRMEKLMQVYPVIDNIIRNFADEQHLPGVAYGLVVDGKLVYKGNIGYTDIDKKIPVTSSSMFRIASMSKSFAAMAILKLRDEGKLSLDDPAYYYVPELKDLKYPTADAPLITIRDLLTHGAGFPEDNPWGDRQLADTDKDFMEFLENGVSFSNPPEVAFEYSNLGFALIGKIITNVSGIRYQDYVKNNICAPLGMNNTTYEYGEVPPDQLAHGYRWLNEKWNEEELLHDTPDGSWGAMGSIISSVDEFADYMALHLAAWPPNNTPDNGPVKRSSVREMHHPWRWSGFDPSFRFPDGRTCGITSAYCYGLGWMKDCDGKTYISHSGGLPGFGSNWRIMPEYGIGFVSFANRTYAPMSYINLVILDSILRMADLQPMQIPPSDILEQRKNDLVRILPDWKDAEQSGVFAENFFPDYPIDTLRKKARELFNKAGRILSVEEVKPQNQLRGSFIMEGENTNLQVHFTLSPENPPLIQAYDIKEIPNN